MSLPFIHSMRWTGSRQKEASLVVTAICALHKESQAELLQCSKQRARMALRSPSALKRVNNFNQ
jgi:hypothetical protein